jgi:hypothetical protein
MTYENFPSSNATTKFRYVLYETESERSSIATSWGTKRNPRERRPLVTKVVDRVIKQILDDRSVVGEIADSWAAGERGEVVDGGRISKKCSEKGRVPSY